MHIIRDPLSKNLPVSLIVWSVEKVAHNSVHSECSASNYVFGDVIVTKYQLG